MAEMKEITQAAMETANAVVKAITDVADLAEGSTRRNAAANVDPRQAYYNWNSPHF